MYQGYKERCLYEDNAIAMWSFDGDQYDRATGNPAMEFIIDEVENQNPAQIIHESPINPNLTIGHLSLVELEQSNQYSAIFGKYNSDQHHPWGVSKTYLSIPHSPAFSFPERGSFSVEFIFRKDNITEWFNWVYRTYGDIVGHTIEPVIRKFNVFNIYFEIGTFLRRLVVSGPGETFYIESTIHDFFSRTSHVVLTWEVNQITEFEFEGIQRFYVNGKILSESKKRFYNTFPNTNTTSPIEIGGTSENSTFPNNVIDRNKSRLYIDQISIYGYALSELQVVEHYKKIFSYRKIIVYDNPEHYWPLDDQETVSDNLVKPEVGNFQGRIFGDIERHTEGPNRLIGHYAVQCHQGGFIHFCNETIYGNYCSIPFQINRDYTLEFWFLTEEYEQGPLLSMFGFSSNFDGLLVEINRAHNIHTPGALQFTERRNVYCSHNGSYNDGKWHHFLVRRLGTKIEMFVDGVLKSEIHSASHSSISFPGNLFLFGNSASYFVKKTKLSNLALYPYALSDIQIKTRANYLYKFVIRGIVTLQGNPFPATLRFYYSDTGQLIKEITANEFTGEYKIELPDNRMVDILIFDKYNKNVRYRAYGPVIPNTYQEFPIQL